MTTTLQKLYTQIDRKGFDQSQLKITVEYDTVEKRWTQLLHILVFNTQEKTWTDITHIMFNCFHDQTENMIDSVNWAEVYATSRDEDDLHPVFKGILERFKIQ